RGIFQDPVVWIKGQTAGLSEGLYREGRFGAAHVDALHFTLTIGIDFKFERHAKEIEILADLPDNAEAFLDPEGGVLDLEFRRTGAIDPLREKGSQLAAVIFFGDSLQVSHRGRLSGKPAHELIHGFVVGSVPNHP